MQRKTIPKEIKLEILAKARTGERVVVLVSLAPTV